MTDRELLELAAKAANIYLGADRTECGVNVDGVSWPQWNPLTDDGDALRLAVKLKLDVLTDCLDGVCISSAQLEEQCEPDLGDPYAATRRAIVRAAAEIGKGMK
jgi:hypothetical protein